MELVALRCKCSQPLGDIPLQADAREAVNLDQSKVRTAKRTRGLAPGHLGPIWLHLMLLVVAQGMGKRGFVFFFLMKHR